MRKLDEQLFYFYAKVPVIWDLKIDSVSKHALHTNNSSALLLCHIANETVRCFTFNGLFFRSLSLRLSVHLATSVHLSIRIYRPFSLAIV